MNKITYDMETVTIADYTVEIILTKDAVKIIYDTNPCLTDCFDSEQVKLNDQRLSRALGDLELDLDADIYGIKIKRNLITLMHKFFRENQILDI